LIRKAIWRNYYFAAISMIWLHERHGTISSGKQPARQHQVEFPTLRPSTTGWVRPGHAKQQLDEARMMELNAVQLDPGNVELSHDLRPTSCSRWAGGKDAVTVIRNAMHLAQFSARHRNGRELSMHAQEYAQAQEQGRSFSQPVNSESGQSRIPPSHVFRKQIRPPGSVRPTSLLAAAHIIF